jgi:hypothetical protein
MISASRPKADICANGYTEAVTRARARLKRTKSPTRISGRGSSSALVERGRFLLLAGLHDRAVAEPFHQDRVLPVVAVLHRVFDDPAEAGIVENAIVDDEAEGADFITPPSGRTRRASPR